ncbi:MAG: trypsin-like peptidase domain-containing protein [Actinomycetes bacterium]
MTDERMDVQYPGGNNGDTLTASSPYANPVPQADGVTPVPYFGAPDPTSRVIGPPAPVQFDSATAPVAFEPPLFGADSRDDSAPTPTLSSPYSAAPYAGAPYPGAPYAAAGATAAGATAAGEWSDQPPQSPVDHAPRSGGAGKFIALAVASGLLAGAVGGVGGYTLARNSGTASTSASGSVIPQTAADLSARPSGSIAAVAASVLPTVVQIEERDSNGGGTGSGFVIRQDGYILTNNHVVAGSVNGGSLSVRFQDGTTKSATIVGRDPSYDLAVVKVDMVGLKTATLGNSDGVVVGDSTIAVGSPLRLEGTVTSGIISALNRPVTAGGSGESSYINAIQTDAAINPGNSGGPLVDAEGKVIGVNSAIASLGQSGASQSGSIGLGFAIPINQAKRVADEIIAHGVSSHPVIGVQVDMAFAGPGAQIKTVTPGGAADKAGLKADDVITKVGDRQVNDPTELIVAIRAHAPGDEVVMTVSSGGSERQVTITLGSDGAKG